MAEKALAAVIQEANVQGISTRSVDDLVKAMDMDGIFKSQVSRLCGEIDEKVQGFLNRPLEGLIRMETVPRGLLKRQWRTATPRPCLGVMRRDHDQQPTPGHHRIHLGKILLATCQLPLRDVAEAGKGRMFRHRLASLIESTSLP